MWRLFKYFVIFSMISLSNGDPSMNMPSSFEYPNIKDEVYQQPVNLMAPMKAAHTKDQVKDIDDDAKDARSSAVVDGWPQYDYSKFDDYLANNKEDDTEHNRIKRRAKRRRNLRRRNKQRKDSDETRNKSSTEHPLPQAARRANEHWESQQAQVKKSDKKSFDTYDPPAKRDSEHSSLSDLALVEELHREGVPIDDYESSFVEMPKDLYQAHLRPGVIFRIHLSEAVLKMQYRTYSEDKDESVIEADVEYLRLTRKVISDEITKFEDLKWLVGWFNNRSELIQEHTCNTRYFAVGIPPTQFTHSEEYMKRMCLFDNVYIDHIPYVIGEDGSLMAAVAPPVLHCDAATCTSVPFIDSVMFDEKLGRTNVRTVTRCQASCRAHCRNDPDCLKRCSDRCLRADN